MFQLLNSNTVTSDLLLKGESKVAHECPKDTKITHYPPPRLKATAPTTIAHQQRVVLVDEHGHHPKEAHANGEGGLLGAGGRRGSDDTLTMLDAG